MFTPAFVAVFAAIVFATSFLSGIFGMAGGLFLLGFLLVTMEVAPAMVLFGVTQTASNGWRVVLWWKHVQWSIFWPYLVGAAVTFIILRWIAIVPNKAWVYIGMGLSPFILKVLPKTWQPDITRPGMPYFCGIIILAMHLLFGTAGQLLDVFYQASKLDRKAIVATKAVTQTVSHMARVAYFGSFASAMAVDFPWWLFALAIGLAIAGTTSASRVLERMTDASFRLWSGRLIQTLSVGFLIYGVWLLAKQHGWA